MITPSYGLTATERVLPRLALDWTTGLAQLGVDVTRAGVATFVGSNGFIQLAVADTQRIDWTTGLPGLLVEESRTNFQINSNNFDAWAKSNVTVNLDATEVSPDGTNNANKITLTSSSGSVTTNPSVALSAGEHTVSVYAKKGNTDYIVLRLRQPGVTDIAFVRFNLATGAVDSTTAGSGSIKDVGGGWYQCTAIGTAASANHTIIIYPNNTTGQSTGEFVYCYGAQLEAGAFPTSYIPTEASAVTRNADVATMTGTNFSDWFNPTEGTFYCESTPSKLIQGETFCSADTDSSNRMTLFNNNNQGAFFVRDNNVEQAFIICGTLTNNQRNRIVSGYKQNSFNIGTNSVLGSEDTTGTIPTVSTFYIGSYSASAGNYLNGTIQKIMYWPQRLINAELQSFSK